MRKISLLIVSVILCLSVASVASADTDQQDVFTQAEIQQLKNQAGLTDEEIAEYPTEVLRDLIDLDAKLLAKGPKIGFRLASEKSDEGEFQTFDLTSDDITLSGAAWSVVSDWYGYGRIYIIGQWDWNIWPSTAATDKMSIGYPDTAGFILRTQNGLIDGHETAIQRHHIQNNVWENTEYDYQPSDWSPGVGVAGSFKLEGLLHDDWKGWVKQYVYTEGGSTGTTNIKITYGHSKFSLVPSVGVYPFGLGVTPDWTTETLSYGLTLTWA